MRQKYINRENSVLTIIATYNRGELLDRAIQGVLNQSISCDLIVVDNCSNDKTQGILSKYRDNCRVYIVYSDKNLGCAGGIKVGLEKAVQYDYRYVWIIDDDMVPERTALQKLIKVGNDIAEWGCLSGGVYWKNGDICLPNIPKKGIFRFVKTKEYELDKIKVSMVSWGSMFIKTDIVRKIGYPIEDYFVYTDDYEYSMRISKIASIYLIPASKTTHYTSANRKTSVIKDSADRLDRYIYLFRNDCNFYMKQGIKGICYLVAKVCASALGVILFAPDNKMLRLTNIAEGIKRGITFMPSR